ncbi:MAG: hypothetical protein AB1705_22840 [Verrucomicrobiota bacterium]
MRIRLSRESGSAVLICLIVASIMGMALASYLSLVSAQHLSVARSQAWNISVPVVEGGIEEALSHLYYNGPTNLGTAGWSADYFGHYNKWRQVGDGWAFMTISNATSLTPTVYSRGYVRVPLSNGQWIQRLIMINTRRDNLFTKGLVAKGQITLNGNNVAIDSFDSADPNYSSNGVYVVSKRKANGDVASNSGVTNAIITGNANIFGKASTGPGGTVGHGPNGAVGDLAWQYGGNTGIKPGFSADDMNVSFPDVKLPFSGGFTPGGGSGYQYVISTSGDYRISSLSGSLLIASNANVRLIVDGNISLTGQDKIMIEGGGCLNLYMAGAEAKITGTGVVNQNGNATNFFYWGTTNNTTLAVNGNGSFKGVIYAPNANFTMNGGGNSNLEDITGASVTATARINGNFNFHYDENLGRLNFSRGYIITAWNEL